MRVAAALIVLALAAPATANTPDLFGVGSRATALGGAFTAVADDFSAVWYNPAGIAQIDRAALTLAPIYSQPSLWLDDPGVGRSDVPVPNAGGMYIGFVAPVGRLFKVEELVFGMALYSPYDYVLQTELPARADARYLPAFGDGYRRMSAAFALAYRLFGRVSLGLGIDLFMDLGGGSVIALSAPKTQWDQRRRLAIDLRREIVLDPAVFAGVHYAATDWLSVGVSYRMEARADTKLIPNSFELGGLPPVDMTIHYVNFFRPHQVAVGVRVAPMPALQLSADVVWHQWSAYVGPHAETPSPGFDDIVVPRFGAEVRALKSLKLSAGYFFHQSPVPDQTGVSSFVDNDRHAVSLGLEWDLRKLSFSLPFTLSAHFQAQLMATRETVKDAAALPDADPDLDGKQIANEGYPSFSAGGAVFNAGGSLTVWF